MPFSQERGDSSSRERPQDPRPSSGPCSGLDQDLFFRKLGQVMVNKAFQLKDLDQVMVNGVNVNPPLLTTSALQTTFGSWAVRDAEFTFVDEIEVGETLRSHSPAKHGIRDVRSSAPWT